MIKEKCRVRIHEWLPWWLSCKKPACQCRRRGIDPWVGNILRRRKWQPTPVFLRGKSHGQRSLVGYSPRGHKRVGYHLKAKQQQSSMYTLPPFLLAKPPLLIPCTLGCKLCESMMHLSLFFFFLY